MKASIYNRWIQVGDSNNWILYNTLSDAVFIVDSKTKERLKGGKEGISINATEFYKFANAGVLVDDDVDETAKIKVIYEEKRNDAQEINLTVIPTYACNLSCSYCYEKLDNPANLGEKIIDQAKINALLRFIKNTISSFNSRRLSIEFFGGESLLAKKAIFGFMDRLKENIENNVVCTTRVFTNGTLLTRDLVDKLASHSINYIQTTLDGPKSIHDMYRHYKSGKGTYEDILNGLAMAQDAGISGAIQINLNRNYAHVPELLDDLKSRGLMHVEILFGALYDFSSVNKPCSSMGSSDSFAVTERSIVDIELKMWFEAFKRGFKLHLPPSVSPCQGVRVHSYNIDLFGDIYSCKAAAGYKDLRVGYLKNDGTIQYTNYYYKWMDRDPTRIKSCSECYALPKCLGGCPFFAERMGITYACDFNPLLKGDDYIKLWLKQEYPERLKYLQLSL